MKILEYKSYYYAFLLQHINDNSSSKITNDKKLVCSISEAFGLDADFKEKLEQALQNQTLKSVNSSHVVAFLDDFDVQHPTLGIYRNEEEKTIFKIKRNALSLLEKIKDENSSDDLYLQFSAVRAKHPSLCVAHAILEYAVEGVSEKTMATLKKFANVNKNVDCQIMLLFFDKENAKQYSSLIVENQILGFLKEQLKLLDEMEGSYESNDSKINS